MIWASIAPVNLRAPIVVVFAIIALASDSFADAPDAVKGANPNPTDRFDVPVGDAAESVALSRIGDVAKIKTDDVLCSGVFISDNTLITVSHCVSTARPVYVHSVDGTILNSPLVSKRVLIANEGQREPVDRYRMTNSGADLALVVFADNSAQTFSRIADNPFSNSNQRLEFVGYGMNPGERPGAYAVGTRILKRKGAGSPRDLSSFLFAYPFQFRGLDPALSERQSALARLGSSLHVGDSGAGAKLYGDVVGVVASYSQPNQHGVRGAFIESVFHPKFVEAARVAQSKGARGLDGLVESFNRASACAKTALGNEWTVVARGLRTDQSVDALAVFGEDVGTVRVWYKKIKARSLNVSKDGQACRATGDETSVESPESLRARDWLLAPRLVQNSMSPGFGFELSVSTFYGSQSQALDALRFAPKD